MVVAVEDGEDGEKALSMLLWEDELLCLRYIIGPWRSKLPTTDLKLTIIEPGYSVSSTLK